MRLSTVLVSVLSLLASVAHAAGRPNVVFILADDMGYADLSSYGSTRVTTPNIDRLAQQGVKFTQFYSNGTECTPTRTALLTGRYPQRVCGMECAIGVGNVGRYDDAARLAKQHDLGLPANLSVLPSALRKNDYQSVIVGKWHLGYEPKFHPLEHGFESFVGLIGGNADHFHHVESSSHPTLPGDYVLFRNRELYRDDRYATHLITEEAVDWLKRRPADRPFFLYLAHVAPHNPHQGPGDRRDTPLTGRNFGRNNPRGYRELIEELDKGVGEILATLEAQGLAENTIVIFTSDNGPVSVGETQPLQGLKSTVYEGGIRVPCIVRWPGKIKPGTVSDQVGITMDLTRSIIEQTGAVANGHGLDGVDIIGHVVEAKPIQPRTLYWRGRRGDSTRKAVRDGDLKLIENLEGEKGEVKLFDLAADVGEAIDLSSQRPQDVKRLGALLAQWETDVKPSR
jgi:N-acetylgalactosamine-6-sulfatase